MEWIIIDSGRMSPAKNMAIDEAIMENVQKGKIPPVIRFYDWEPASVSIGYNQNAEDEIDFNILNEKKFGFVRRPTGGRMVLHKNEVTYSVIAPIGDKLGGNVIESYSAISKVLAKGLEFLGLEVSFEKKTLDSKHQRLKSNPCFASSSKYEIKCDGKKIIGSSQVRKNKVLLQHGSILLNENQTDIADLLPKKNKKEKKIVEKFLKRKTISINEYLDKPLEYQEVVKNFVKAFKLSWKNDSFLCKSLKYLNIDSDIKKFYFEKYSLNEWNFKK